MNVIAPEFLEETKLETMRVCALHAFAYCPRLFYLEEDEAGRAAVQEAIQQARQLRQSPYRGGAHRRTA